MSGQEAVFDALRAALEATPHNVALRKHLADLLMESGAYVEATREYRQALDHAPDDAALKLALAEAYVRQERYDVALVILEELLRALDPAPEALLLAARVYAATDALTQAAQAYQRVVLADPTLADPDLEKELPALALAETPPAPAEEPPLFVAPDADETAPDSTLVERPQITFEDVGGMDALKEEIRMKIIYPLTHPELYRAYGKQLGGGILMYGPPGCGKTHLARATAGEVQATFMPIGLHDVLDMWLGNSEKRLHQIFEMARQMAPCVLFFDEVDALGAKRSDLRHSAARHVINQFLSELDGVDTSNEGLLILAATNAPWHLDTALRRPGRFDRVIFVPPPDEAARAAILQILLEDKPAEHIRYPRLARAARDFSGADLRGAVDVAIEGKLREALHSGLPRPLTTRDLLDAIKATHPTTKEWFETARNYAIYANQSGLYDDILAYLKLSGGSSPFA